MFNVNSIEVLQAIQTGVPLLIGKKTLVRVYLEKDSNADIDNCRPAASYSVEGHLVVSVVGDGISATIESFKRLAWDERKPKTLQAQRLSLDYSLNFEFRLADLFASQTLEDRDDLAVEFRLQSLSINGLSAQPPTNIVCRQETFVRSDPLKLHILGLRYRDLNDAVYYPRDDHFKNARRSIENLYPIGRCEASQVVVDAEAEFTLPFSNADTSEPDWEWYYKVSLAHAQLIAHRTLDLDANRGSMDKTWYYAMADYPDDDFFRGAAAGVQPEDVERNGELADFDIVACGPVETAGGLYAAHEIAHCLDLHHPGIGDQARVDSDYPNVEGYISCDLYPDDQRFENPNDLTLEIVEGIYNDFLAEPALFGNHTLKQVIKRYEINRDQGSGAGDLGLKQFKDDLIRWCAGVKAYGAAQHGYRWADWKAGREILSFREHYDFLGYLEPKWISNYSYSALYKNINLFVDAKPRDEPDATGQPPNICIIGVYNENLGTGQIKYWFKTCEAPTENRNVNGRSVRLRFDNLAVDDKYVQHKDRENNKLGDPVFDKAGIFKCIVSEAKCFKGDVNTALHQCRQLYLDIARTRSKADAPAELHYETVDRKVLGIQAKLHRCQCEHQPFNLVRTSLDTESADFYLKFIGEATSDCVYIARARFFDSRHYQQGNGMALTNWMTLGVNFRSSRALYLDKNHCIVPGGALPALKQFSFEGQQLSQRFEQLFEVVDRIEKTEKRPVDLFAFVIELICQSARDTELDEITDSTNSLFDSKTVFKGMIVEKPHQPGEFYFSAVKDEESD